MPNTAFRLSIATAAALAIALPAYAQSQGNAVSPGYYVSGGAGMNFLRDSDTGSTTYRYDLGGIGLGALGYQFGNGLRAEGEFAYRESGVSDASSGAASGSTSSFSLMANGLYDFNIGSAFTPYAGLGIGLARIGFDNVSVPGTNASIDDSDLAFAYQGMAGIAYQFRPNMKVDLGYRYFGTETPRFRTSSGSDVNGHYRDHAVTVSLRYEFGSF